jgi:hypothetical protein
MALVLHRRPSEILHLKGSEVWLLEVDYELLTSELERMATGDEETPEEKASKIREWMKRRQT